MLQFPVGLIHKEYASFATATFFLLGPCNEDVVLCLDLSLCHTCQTMHNRKSSRRLQKEERCHTVKMYMLLHQTCLLLLVLMLMSQLEFMKK